jgi:hypothetical protein
MAEWLTSLQKSFALDVFAPFGVRELIIALVVLVVVYMLVVVLRMKSLSAQRRFEEIAAARYESDLVESQGSRKKAKRGAEVEVTWSASGKDGLDAFYDSTPRIEPKNKYAEPPESTVTHFDQEKLTRLERELSATREELDALRTAFAQTRDSLQAEVERLKAGQRVSPAYGDSLQMAMSGASAEEIAARCGIARAEAELVLSLAQGGSGPGEEVGAPGRNPDQGRSGRSRYGSY